MKTLLRELLFPLIAVLAAFVIGGLVVLAIGDNPIAVYRLLISSSFGLFEATGKFTWDNWGYTLFNATPLIFTGLAVSLAFKCGLLNIGAEGQLYVGAFAAAAAQHEGERIAERRGRFVKGHPVLAPVDEGLPRIPCRGQVHAHSPGCFPKRQDGWTRLRFTGTGLGLGLGENGSIRQV